MQNYKTNNPVSSKIAGAMIENSGIAENQRAAALNAVKRWPGKTSLELAKLSGLDRYILARRLPEIKELKQGDDRRQRCCRVTGRMSVVWELSHGN